MNPQAVDYFISLTHDQYYKQFGNYFGTVIKGIFTDEPLIGYCSQNSYLPYYDGMEDDLKKHTEGAFLTIYIPKTMIFAKM